MNTTSRPVSVSHLVVGLVFLGIAVLWLVGVTTDADTPDMAAWGPVVLIGAGAIGLVATLATARRTRTTQEPAQTAPTTPDALDVEPEHADTTEETR